MADVISLDLELTDQVSKPARAAAQALRQVEAAQERAQRAVTKAQSAFAGAWEKVGSRAARDQERSIVKASVVQMKATQRAMKEETRFAKQQERDTRRMGLLQMQAQKINAAHDKRKGFLGGFKDALHVPALTKAAFWGELAAKGVESVVGGFIDGAKAAVDIVYSGVKAAFSAGAQREQLGVNYKLLLGKSQGAAALADIDRFSGKTRYDDDEIAQMMRPLFNAGFRGTGARSAFAAAGDLNAAGLGETSDFVEQLTKIKLKGGVGAKQLVGMGVDVPAFSKALGAALHTDSKTAMKRAKEGGEGIDPQMLLNLIYEGIERRQGGKLGSGTEAMGQTMGARWHKLGELPNDYLKTISESPAWQTLSDRLGGILEELNPNGEKGQQIVGSIMKTFDRISAGIQRALTPENIEKFIKWVERAVTAVGNLPEAIEKVINVASKLAGFLDKVISVLSVVEAVNPNNFADEAKKAMPEGDWLGRTQWWKDMVGADSPSDAVDTRQVAGASATGAGGRPVTIDQRGLQFNVSVDKDQDPKEAGKKFGEGFNSSQVRSLEKAMQERGGN